MHYRLTFLAQVDPMPIAAAPGLGHVRYGGEVCHRANEGKQPFVEDVVPHRGVLGGDGRGGTTTKVCVGHHGGGHQAAADPGKHRQGHQGGLRRDGTNGM